MKLAILGSRGIPAKHGGFETFAERLSLYLMSTGWEVTVYCQVNGNGKIYENSWNDIRLVHIPVRQAGAMGTVVFDLKSTFHSLREDGLKLTLGYNTAIIFFLYRLKGRKNFINMDGIEWRRPKWSFLERAWLYLNEQLACYLGSHLIADNPHIKAHLLKRVSESKISMIPYGADRIDNADEAVLVKFGLKPYGYAIVIARPEPDNSILEIVSAFSKKPRKAKLVLLGNYDIERKAYHRQVCGAAGIEVVFLGAIYDKEIVGALRYFALLYVHGHQVGGTNPSLVEAMGAGSPVLAYDNCFNRWVSGAEARFFRNEQECAAQFDMLLADTADLEGMRRASRKRHAEMFTWDKVLKDYETLLKG